MDDTVFLFDVDNTLIDNDRVQQDIKTHLSKTYGEAARDRYWAIFEERFATLGFADYLGALERYRQEVPYEPGVLRLGNWLIDYPFGERLYPGALDAVNRLRQLGRAVVLSDGDAVFQPRKIQRSGLWSAFDGEILIFVHKEEELDAVERLYPARRYVLIDDKLRILSAVKSVWGDRVTTVFPRQGHYAHDSEAVEAYPRPDLTIGAIRDIVALDRAAFAP